MKSEFSDDEPLYLQNTTTNMNRLKGLSKGWVKEGYSSRLREAMLLSLIILAGIVISNILSI